MSGERKLDRRSFVASGLAATSTVLLGGCEDLSDQAWVKRVLNSAETLTRVTQEALLSPQALAREFTEADLSREFRANGSTNPDDPTYVAHAKTGFAEWKLVVGGQVEEPLELSLAELRAMPSRTQITRHDCVEGWSCIGKWRGVPLSALLTRARLKPAVRYIVFYCADSLGSTGTEADQYYKFDRPRRRLPCPDHSRLRDERSGSSRPIRRTAQAPRGAPARLQNGEICDEHRGRRQPRRHSRWARRVLGGSGLRVVRWNLRAKLSQARIANSARHVFGHRISST